jgi:hypothetical protein
MYTWCGGPISGTVGVSFPRLSYFFSVLMHPSHRDFLKSSTLFNDASEEVLDTIVRGSDHEEWKVRALCYPHEELGVV